ncbi:MAG: restriction endonuclease [Roseiarcus sp.]
MSVPSHQRLMAPTLAYLCQCREEVAIAKLEDEVAKALNLSAEDLSYALPSGQRSVFANRLNWARAYLVKAGLIDTPRRGFYRALQRGRELLAEGVEEIDVAVLSRYPEFVAWRAQQRPYDCVLAAEGKESPEEQIALHHQILNASLARELVRRVHSFPPSFFERLIVDLLVRMGYGGGRPEMGRALGRAGDGGIDGLIQEDELGLDVIYIQAKRFSPGSSVPLREVRDFVGGLEGRHAVKGVFVTTSHFPPTAYEFVTRVSKRVALIDGRGLADLMIRHRVGVRVKQTYDVNRIDEGYFAE